MRTGENRERRGRFRKRAFAVRAAKVVRTGPLDRFLWSGLLQLSPPGLGEKPKHNEGCQQRE
jgi:hypothetical protein